MTRLLLPILLPPTTSVDRARLLGRLLRRELAKGIGVLVASEDAKLGELHVGEPVILIEGAKAKAKETRR